MTDTDGGLYEFIDNRLKIAEMKGEVEALLKISSVIIKKAEKVRAKMEPLIQKENVMMDKLKEKDKNSYDMFYR